MRDALLFFFSYREVLFVGFLALVVIAILAGLIVNLLERKE